MQKGDIVKCINNSNIPSLRKGKCYILKEIQSHVYVQVWVNEYECVIAPLNRFKKATNKEIEQYINDNPDMIVNMF